MATESSLSTLWLSLKENFDNQLSEWETIGMPAVTFAHRAARLAMIKLQEAESLKKEILNDMNGAANTIFFYKTLKPYFLGRNIYYTQRLKLEASRPRDPEALTNYCRLQFNNIDKVYMEHEFIRKYLQIDATFLDDRLFFDAATDGAVAMQGAEPLPDGYPICYDRAVSELVAADLLVAWVTEMQASIVDTGARKKKLRFTKPKIKAIELAYALYANGCFNDGKAMLKDIVESIEDAWGIDMGYYPRGFQEIIYRKVGYDVFCKELSGGLVVYIENLLDKNTG